MKHPTQDQLLNAAIMLDGAHPAVAAWLVRMAEQQAAEPVADIADLINNLEQLAHRKGELWERCQGKLWPQAESDEFTALRDTLIPRARQELAKRVTAPAQQAAQQQAAQQQEPVACDKDPRGCWNVRCQLGGVCKNTHPAPTQQAAQQAAEPVDRDVAYGDGGYACCEGGPCAADVHNASLSDRHMDAIKPFTADVMRIIRDAGMTFHLGLPHDKVIEQMTRVVDLAYAEASIKAAVVFSAPTQQPLTEAHVTDGSKCWCDPELDYKDPDTGAEVWVHRGKQ